VLAPCIRHADIPAAVRRTWRPPQQRHARRRSITQRTSTLHGFYRYAARHGAAPSFPFTGIERPAVDDER
jgi:site-specific recombinase XerD